jgi:hypothetical protein
MVLQVIFGRQQRMPRNVKENSEGCRFQSPCQQDGFPEPPAGSQKKAEPVTPQCALKNVKVISLP